MVDNFETCVALYLSNNRSSFVQLSNHLNGSCIKYEIAIGLLNLVFCLSASFGNAAVLLSIWKTASLHSVANLLLANLAFTDLAVGLLAQPIFVVMMFLDGTCRCSLFNLTIFYIFLGATLLFSGASFLSVTAISVDRFLALELHLKYKALVTPRKVQLVIALIWISPGLTATMQWWISIQTLYLLSGIIISCCLIGLFLIFLRIYFIVRRHHIQIQSQNQQLSNNDGNAVNMAKLRKSSLNVFLVFIMFFFCYTPCFLSMLETVRSGHYNWIAFSLSCTLVLLNSTLNPILYCFRVTEIRQAVKNVVFRLSAEQP